MADSDDAPRASARRDAEPRCGSCHQGAGSLRRGLCALCYARWVRARPVGVGAWCACCAERRMDHLRHFELRGLWVVLCHNCGARAERVQPAPRTVDGLLQLLLRERRARAEQADSRGRRAVGTGWPWAPGDRRPLDRRRADAWSPPDDADALAEQAVESESDVRAPGELGDSDEEPITGVHAPVDLV